MNDRKRAVLIGTMCGTGKCSLAAALPVLAAAGIEVCVAPTGTSPLPGTAVRDLSGDLFAYAEQWKKAGYSFDAMVFEFPETEEQAGALSAFLQTFREKDNLVLFGSSGWNSKKVQVGVSPEKSKLVQRFCAQSDLVILPAGDAAALMGEKNHDGPWSRRAVETLLRSMCFTGAKSAVATDVWFSPELMGSAVYSAGNGTVSYAFSHRISGEWPGTGDLFCAALLAGLLYGMRQSAAVQLAVDFAADCIRKTKESGCDSRFGLKFEACLPKLIRQLGAPKRQKD